MHLQYYAIPLTIFDALLCSHALIKRITNAAANITRAIDVALA